MFNYENKKKNVSFNVLLPNLRYINNQLYFKPKYSIKVKNNNKIENKSEFLLKDINLEGTINCMGIKLKCKILEESLRNGVKANIQINTDEHISKIDMQKYARQLEATILNINLDDDNSSESYDNYDNYYENKVKYVADIITDVHSYTEENNQINNDYENYNDYEEEYYSDR
jgi:hypothetical protein